MTRRRQTVINVCFTRHSCNNERLIIAHREWVGGRCGGDEDILSGKSYPCNPGDIRKCNPRSNRGRCRRSDTGSKRSRRCSLGNGHLWICEGEYAKAIIMLKFKRDWHLICISITIYDLILSYFTYPITQVHLKAFIISWQTPPLRHGLLAHSSISTSHCVPVKPASFRCLILMSLAYYIYNYL